MNGLSGLRRRVDALLRKYAREITVVRVRRLADEYSLQWTVAVADRQPPPDTHSFILYPTGGRRRIPAHYLHVGP